MGGVPHESWRMHEQVRLPCIFGCAESGDHLLHYTACSQMWKTIDTELGILFGRMLPSQSARLCMRNPSYRSLAMLAIAFKGYHWLKIDRYDEILSNCTSGSFEVTHDLFALYVRLLVAELPSDFL